MCSSAGQRCTADGGDADACASRRLAMSASPCRRHILASCAAQSLARVASSAPGGAIAKKVRHTVASLCVDPSYTWKAAPPGGKPMLEASSGQNRSGNASATLVTPAIHVSDAAIARTLLEERGGENVTRSARSLGGAVSATCLACTTSPVADVSVMTPPSWREHEATGNPCRIRAGSTVLCSAEMNAKAPPAMRVEDGSSGWSNVLILCSRSSHSTLRCPFQTHAAPRSTPSGELRKRPPSSCGCASSSTQEHLFPSPAATTSPERPPPTMATSTTCVAVH
mmetsp:Transcript_33545/g.79377  ORF Transcript_33545/g.79377 Transcript_33545/m.79377 type:complete len:282 (+) Transcript_33545:242-1087(+)